MMSISITGNSSHLERMLTLTCVQPAKNARISKMIFHMINFSKTHQEWAFLHVFCMIIFMFFACVFAFSHVVFHTVFIRGFTRVSQVIFEN